MFGILIVAVVSHPEGELNPRMATAMAILLIAYTMFTLWTVYVAKKARQEIQDS